jgi:MOSC domain-containing protein YiiM
MDNKLPNVAFGHEIRGTSIEVLRSGGVVVALHICPRSFLPLKSQPCVMLIPDVGIQGDRYAVNAGFYSDRPEPGRQITLFEEETLEALKRDHQLVLSAADHRRNVTTRGVALNHLVNRRFRLGDTLLEGTRLSTPCRHIEQILGREVFSLFLNRCGLHARILRGGVVNVGDKVMAET